MNSGSCSQMTTSCKCASKMALTLMTSCLFVGGSLRKTESGEHWNATEATFWRFCPGRDLERQKNIDLSKIDFEDDELPGQVKFGFFGWWGNTDALNVY